MVLRLRHFANRSLGLTISATSFLSPLGWGVTPVAIAKPLPEHCLLLAQTPDTMVNGKVGATGEDGEPGIRGIDADSLTVFDDGSPLTLNLTGRDGGGGETGKNGLPPDCPPVNVQQTRENVRMANGGDGGNGGNGGDGGNGGSLTIYTRNVTNLNHIAVNAAGGQGGQPGQGGASSAGCDCAQPFWTIETCSGGRPGDNNYRCITETFTCYDGQDGINGRNGIVGRAGNLGKLTVLNLDRPLEPDRPSISVPLSTLKDKGFTLSKNLWETRTGATQLLAPGSVIDDEYQLLTQRIEKSFFLLWNAPQPFERFAGTNANLTLNETDGIQVDLPDDLWLEGTTQQRENVTEFVVYNALWESDATRLGRIALSGNGRNLKLFVTDEAGQSNLMATKFRLRYRVTQEDPRFRPPSTYSTKYDGEVPADAVTVNGNQFRIDVGKLPIAEEDLRAGTGVDIILFADRTFSGYTAEQRLNLRSVIRGSFVPTNEYQNFPETPTSTPPSDFPSSPRPEAVPRPNEFPAPPSPLPVPPQSIPEAETFPPGGFQ